MLSHIARVGLVTLAVSAASPAFAFGLNVFGQGRYLSLTDEKQEDDTEDTEDPKASTGIAAGVTAQIKFLDLKIINLFAGVGIDVWSLSEKEAKQKFLRTSIPLEFGISLNALPMLTFQLSGVYDYGLSGKGTAEPVTGFKTTYSTKDDSAYAANLRALLTVAPMVRAGLIAQYYTGSYKVKVDKLEYPSEFQERVEAGGGQLSTSGETSDAIKHTGYALGAVVGISF